MLAVSDISTFRLLVGLTSVADITLTIRTPLKKAVHERICRFYYELDPWRAGEGPHIISWTAGPRGLQALLTLLRRHKVKYSLELTFE
jgi:hypothetical protein